MNTRHGMTNRGSSKLIWDRTIYNGEHEFSNGIRWWRWTVGPLCGWGLWTLTLPIQNLHATTPDGPSIRLGSLRRRLVYILRPDDE